MTIFHYFATLDESLEMLDDLCHSSLRVIVDRVYDEPAAPIHPRVTEALTSLLTDAPGFYLLGPFTTFPVQFTRLDAGPAAGQYVVDALTKGPVLQGLRGRANGRSGEEAE